MIHRSTVTPRSRLLTPFLTLAASLVASCGAGGGGGSGSFGVPGSELEKPGGGTFFVDPNHGGNSTRMHLAEMFWARLVDVHDVDGLGRPNVEPIFRDFAINENIQTDGNNYRLETNPITLKTRLIILRERGAPDLGLKSFDQLLRFAAENLPPIQPKNDDGSTGDQYSFVARNSAIILRFDDALDDDAESQLDLNETVRVLTGYPPVTPFSSRLIFDPNHGALVGTEFHSTRVLIDLTVTDAERALMSVPQPVNAVGLPASVFGTSSPNVSIRIPTDTDFGTGQFKLLHNLRGSPLSATGNGPSDINSSTRDIVRAMRSGNTSDQNNGFTLDFNPPRLVGSWGLRVDSAIPAPGGIAGLDFLLDITFTTICRLAPEPGDVIALGDVFLEVAQAQAPPDVDGKLRDVLVHSLSDGPLGPGATLVGNAQFLSTYQPADPVPRGCWVSFVPPPTSLPATGVLSDTKVVVRFSEPMDPQSLSPVDNFETILGDSNTIIGPNNVVVGEIEATTDLKEFTFAPKLPLPHSFGAEEPYHVRLQGPTDLAGNALADALAPVNFTMEVDQPPVVVSGTVLRFDSQDELDPIGAPDLRGSFFVDLDRGVIRPRPATITSYPVDRTNPVPSIMIPFPRGVQTPLTPLGSKLHTVWRYCDLGWQVLDETKYNLDVFGLSWAPIRGQVTNDFYENFEIRLAHSRRLPDEAIDQVFRLPLHQNSGLAARGTPFSENVLVDPLSPQKTVYPKNLGYQISSSDLFVATTGRVMLPFPLNRGPGSPTTFTWRDTAVLAKGQPLDSAAAAPYGVGIPLGVEKDPPLQLEQQAGYVAGVGQVPSFGLPLLIEYRCYPSNVGIGFNAFDISLAINSSALPSFRSYSSGGFDSSGTAVVRNPDSQNAPRGGFNPSNGGNPTNRADDNAFYIGQLDAVPRITRVHTVWINTSFPDPDYEAPVVLPQQSDLPGGTQIIVEYRGADGFDLGDLDSAFGAIVDEASFPFNAQQLNAYGDIFVAIPPLAPAPPGPARHHLLGSAEFPGSVDFLNGVATWTDDINAIDGAQYVQMRVTFVSNIENGLSPELSSIGIAYSQ